MTAEGYRLVGGTVLDGTGRSSRQETVAIHDGRLIPPARLDVRAATFDVSGCVVMPGLVDAHANQTWGPLAEPSCALMVRQGVTAAVTGNCGGSLFPVLGAAGEWIRRICADHSLPVSWKDLAGYAEALSQTGIDLFPLVGHAMLRASVVGFASRPLHADELRQLIDLIEAQFTDGAWGVSFGLGYPPGAFADRDELLEVCRAAARADRPACFHIRLESADVVDSVAEVCDLAARTGVDAVICHHKVLGRRHWGKTVETLPLVERAWEQGARVFLDVYPFTEAVRNLASLLPDEAHEGGRDELVRRLEDPAKRGWLRDALARNVRGWDADWRRTNISEAPGAPGLVGRNAAEVVNEAGLDGLLDALAASKGRVMTVYDGASWDDIERVVAFPYTMIGSDGDVQTSRERGHPRSSRTFPTFFEEIVTKRRILTWEEAARRVTSLPASVFRLPDRHVLAEGELANICVVADESPDWMLASEVWPRHLFRRGEGVVLEGKPCDVLSAHLQRRTWETPGTVALS